MALSNYETFKIRSEQIKSGRHREPNGDFIDTTPVPCGCCGPKLNDHQKLVRQFAAEVVVRTHTNYRRATSRFDADRLQHYMTGVLDTAQRAGAITTDESRMAQEAVQGASFDEVWWL